MRGFPSYSRAQQGVILLLGAAVLLLWGWRAHFWRPLAPPPALHADMVFVEVAGAAAHPGVYAFPHPPPLSEVWRTAGIQGPVPDGDDKIPRGSRIDITTDGRYQLSRITGAQLLTLGLAMDLNQATLEDLIALPGIGPVLARRIIDYRTAHGPFGNIEDLEQVSGIGPKKLEKLKPYLLLQTQKPTAPEVEE